MGTRHKRVNQGVINTGTQIIVDSAQGYRPTVNNVRESTPPVAPAAASTEAAPEIAADVGVIAVLPEEMRPVIDLLKRSSAYRKVKRNGTTFHVGTAGPDDRPVRVAATRTLKTGQQSAVAAVGKLRRFCAPPVVALVGIAGRLHDDLDLGDVAVSTAVLYYEMRKEVPGEVRRRGDVQPVAASILAALNDFFDEQSQPCRLELRDPDGQSRWCTVLAGPIGSGEAVVADHDSAIRRYLAAYNDKTLALDTEAAGVAQGCYEASGDDITRSDWLSIRGISDRADATKDDAYHSIASWHAVAVLERLLPYLKVS